MILFNRFQHINYSYSNPNDFYKGYFDFHVCYVQIEEHCFRIHSRQSLLHENVMMYGPDSDSRFVDFPKTIVLTNDNLESMIIQYVFPEINKIIARQKRINETIEFFDKISVML